MVLSSLKSFDAYPKFHEDVKVRTFSGATVSIVAVISIFLLFCSELSLFLKTERQDRLFVDTTMGEKLRINFDVTFPHIPCALLSLDAMDVSGSNQLDVAHHVKKSPLIYGTETGQSVLHEVNSVHKEGTNQTHPHEEDEVESAKAKIAAPGYCGSCFGAGEEKDCCNTCDAVRKAYRLKGWSMTDAHEIEQCVAEGETHNIQMSEIERGDGCRMDGYLQVAKVAGNFHFAPGKSYQRNGAHVHDLSAFHKIRFNLSHTIHRLSFGEDYPGKVEPLDATQKVEPDLPPQEKKSEEHQMKVFRSLEDLFENLVSGGEEHKGGMFMYYTKVVPTNYKYLRGDTIRTNQYSVTEHFKTVSQRDANGLPGVFFFYELSPIMVEVTEMQQSFTHFVTQLCAILGGVFTVAGIIDKVVYGAIQKLEQKIEIGKYG